MSLSIGAALMILGGVNLLLTLNVIGVGLPQIPTIILEIFLGVSGFYLMIDGFLIITMHPMLTLVDILLGVAIAALGILPLLNQLTGMFFPINFFHEIIINVCFIIAGGLLIFNSWNF